MSEDIMYCSLLGRSFMYLEKYDDALPVLIKSTKLILLEDDRNIHKSIEGEYSDTIKALKYVAHKQDADIRELIK